MKRDEIRCRICSRWQVRIDRSGHITDRRPGVQIQQPRATSSTDPLIADGARPAVDVHRVGPFEIGPPAWLTEGEASTRELRTMPVDDAYGWIQCGPPCGAISVLRRIS